MFILFCLKPRPYPVSRYPIYENPNVMMPNVERQPNEKKLPPTIHSIQEAFMSAAPAQAFEQLLERNPQLVHEPGEGDMPCNGHAIGLGENCHSANSTRKVDYSICSEI